MNNLHVLELSSYQQPRIQESKRENWVEFGEDNDYFQFLIDRHTNSTTNSAIINNVCRLVYGRGLSALNASRKPNEYAQMIALFSTDCIRKMIVDRKLLGQFTIQVHYSKDRKSILKAYHIPVNLIRAEKCNKDGDIAGYYYSDNWQDIRNFPPIRYSAFGFSNDNVEILFVKPYSVGLKYYAYPDYQGAVPYMVLEEEISKYLLNEVQNGFSGTKVVNFNNGTPSDEQQEIISQKVLNKLTGSRGQKVIIAFNDNLEAKTTIDDIPLNDAPEHYTYLSEECLRKIMLGHNVTSPLLFGVTSANGFSSNADELKNSAILFDNMVIRPFQEELIYAFNKILAYNGISLNLFFKTLQPLEFTDLENAQSQDQVAEETGVALTKQKKNDEALAQALIDMGEDPHANWVLIDEFDVDYDTEDEIDAEIKNLNKPKNSLLSKVYNFVSTGTANPRAKSEQDEFVEGIKFITRYKYANPISEDSRLFCQKMVGAEKIYRKEDIIRMGTQIVNQGWGPKGADTYSIWLYKGGGACHHVWKRQTFVAFDDKTGIDPLSPNAKTISTGKAEKAGYRIRNPNLVAMRPIDMPNQGFLPTNKQ
jgi:hypothetical protein